MNTSNISVPGFGPGPVSSNVPGPDLTEAAAVSRIENLPSNIVKQGWLYKRGEHIRNWRARYFVLLDDGSLIGFKNKPSNMEDPLNNFTVKGCQIMPSDKPKPFTFVIRGLQWTTVIERTFHVDSEKEREEWMDAIKYVSEQVSGGSVSSSSGYQSSTACEDVDMKPAEQAFTVEDLSAKFSLQGTSSSKTSGKRKVTLENFEFLKVLGKGTFGKVILCREKLTGHLYAVKILKKGVIMERDEVEHTRTENRVLRNTNHPFLIVNETCLCIC